MKKILFFLTLSAFLFLVSCNDQPTMVDEPESDQTNSLSKQSYTFADHYIVEYTNESKFLDAVSAVGGKVKYNHSAIKFASVENLSEADAKKLAKKSGVKSVDQDLLIQWVDPSAKVEESHIGSDEGFWPYQWSMRTISAPSAWETGATGNGVRVAVIDGGMSANHIDLVNNIDASASHSFVNGLDWFEDSGDLESPFRHATHVAGIIAAADNGIGTIGVAPSATIIALKALDNGSGSFDAVVAAIMYAADEANADVINMSLGAVFPRNSNGAAKQIQALGAAINFAYQKGVTVIVAAGNDGYDMDHAGMYVSIPAEIQHVICVSATGPTNFIGGADDFDTPASYTNYGQSLIDFAAPGGDFDYPDYPNYIYDMVLSPGGGTSAYYFAAGTSMAAPHVAGVAALIIGKNGGSMKPAQVERVLRASSDDLGKPGNDDFYGAGRVNAYRAVTQ